MSKKMHKASVDYNKITAVEVLRETDKCVYLLYKGFMSGSKERKFLKETDFQAFFDTFEEARDWIVEKRKRQVERLESQLSDAQAKLSNALSLKPEESPPPPYIAV